MLRTLHVHSQAWMAPASMGQPARWHASRVVLLGGDLAWLRADGRADPFVHRIERLRRSFLVAGVDPFVHGMSPHVGLFSG